MDDLCQQDCSSRLYEWTIFDVTTSNNCIDISVGGRIPIIFLSTAVVKNKIGMCEYLLGQWFSYLKH